MRARGSRCKKRQVAALSNNLAPMRINSEYHRPFEGEASAEEFLLKPVIGASPHPMPVLFFGAISLQL
ncbi:MAG: hypothetical protein COA94_03600 [Rickettsiales bacterium]|nr:MAG: hypothetical protein COA94_03600 [Rickettsiales bacterium]